MNQSEWIDTLKAIEHTILDALHSSEQLEPHNQGWRSFVRRLEDAKVAIWHAMDSLPL